MNFSQYKMLQNTYDNYRGNNILEEYESFNEIPKLILLQ